MYFLNNKIKFVIFDLDNTLYDENIYISEVLFTFSRKYHLNFDKNTFLKNTSLREQTNDIFTFWLNSMNFYSKQLQDELFELYQNISLKLSLYDDAKILLDFLFSQGIKIGILTNGTVKAQQNKISSLKELKKYNIDVFYARSLGKEFEKPHEKAFEAILSLMKVDDKKNVLYIGDNLYTDIEGAEKSGLKNIFVNRSKIYKKQINSNLVVEKLDEVIKL
ncbi:TPA: HAD family hydrolase [Campylobacter jejuni]|uniref:HAD family hydrolase n=1 Tax=Campylobacter jejuni TaxID=197 RepID=UPI000F7FCE3A|nr:HAD family hydrolase [Campylobacter jejuni]RTJ88854.1 HAD family hydrolase [Campylobacter jejuni]HED7286592.1 HAD family hydrolase [Campylobacter jejuni]HEG2562081.1 HAD family hydrolase [Campylobacter jejuni]HEG7986101.1 HAD family hydrolase [Campylobacter jejuni]HEG8042557.1 HAD family hydrolase [Campylobacter jejuni]